MKKTTKRMRVRSAPRNPTPGITQGSMSLATRIRPTKHDMIVSGDIAMSPGKHDRTYERARLDLVALGKRLRDVRAARCLAATRVDDLAGVGRGTVLAIEDARRPMIALDVVVRVAHALDMDLSYLVLGSDSKGDPLSERQRLAQAIAVASQAAQWEIVRALCAELANTPSAQHRVNA